MGFELGNETNEKGGALIGDLAGIGHIGAEIIRAFGKVTGVIYRPRAIRSEAEAKAHEILVIAEAQSKADAITRLRADEIDFEIRQRAAHRVVATAIQEQNNIENIVEASLALAQQPANDEAKTLDDGWLFRFLDGAKSVTHSELRQIWSAILARQARQGQFSLRLLDCVKNLEPEDVSAFENFVWIERSWNTLLTWPVFLGASRHHNCSLLSNEEVERLIDAGLIQHRFYMAAKSLVPAPASLIIRLAGRRYQVTALGDTLTLHDLSYTRIGKELESIVPPASSTMSTLLSTKVKDFIERVTRSAAGESLTLKLAEK